MKLDTRVYPDLDALSRAAVEEVLRVVAESVAALGRCAIALSGGRTPARMYALCASEYNAQTPWDRVHLFWGDERFVPQNDPRSNYHMAREALITRVPIPAANVHPVPTNFSQPQQAADAYEAELQKFFGSAQPAFDVQLLGLGGEGHTASLFPGSPALEEKKRWVAAVCVPAEPPDRLTLTPVVFNCGRNTFFLVAGEDKRKILSALRREPDSKISEYPAARIRPSGRVLWFLDQAAAG
ncbi:MAG TPA: 6-phosphogluconolactonase [Candidatus Limnocylindria bacterium]|nr:6-phosphogluconolactonase [Candidatus Limnocylindria bacterium]